jgi:hypothetical protein
LRSCCAGPAEGALVGPTEEPAAAIAAPPDVVGADVVGEDVAMSAAGPLQAVVLGPVRPGGAPPGSGTQAPGFEGSVSLTPGWFGPSQE